MHKLINVAGKIKAFRETLGMTQTEFIVAVSQKLAETTKNPSLAAKLRAKPMNPSLASQWESNVKNRANPSQEHLKAIALLSDKPWETMWWFMRDDIDYKRGYELYPDGHATIAPADMSPEDEEEMLNWIAEEQAKHDATPSKELTAWMQDEDRMWDLHVKGRFSEEEQNRQRRMLGILSLLPHEPCPSCGGINANIAKKCEYCAHKLESIQAIVKPVESKAQVIVGNTKNAVPVVGVLNEAQKTLVVPSKQGGLNALALMARQGPVVADFVEFPPLPPLRQQTSLQESEEDFGMQTANNFWSAVKFFTSTDHFIPNEHFGQRVQAGVLSQYVNYFDGDRAIQVAVIHRDTEIRSLRRSLQTKMMELCFVDRMKKRTSKKMVLVTSFEKGLKLERLEKHLEELSNSSELLGVQIQFASGPLEAAEMIAAFKMATT